MKKLTLTGLVAAGVLLTTACSEDNTFQPQPGEGGNVTFTIQLPAEGLGSRAFADGHSATKLNYAVYDAEGNLILQDDNTASFAKDQLTTTVSLSLANGKAYNIAFFAHNGEGAYTFDAEAKTFTVDYAAMTAYNSTDHDAFFALKEVPTVTAPVNQTVTLTRPLAQINWGTNDLAIYNNVYGTEASKLTTKVSIDKVYTTYNMLDGTLAGETDVEFPLLARPENEGFPVTGYEYLSMNYVLVPAESSLVEAVLTPNNGTADLPAVTVANMPVQANYRTNIYGALLTSPANITVVKEPNFEKPDYDNGYKSVSTAEDLTAAIEAGIPVKLAEDIDVPKSNNAYRFIIKHDSEIDLNGNSITASEDNECRIFNVNNDKKLTIRDSKGNGKIIGSSGHAIVELGDNSALIIEGGHFDNIYNEIPTDEFRTSHCIIDGSTNSSVIINGGTFGSQNNLGNIIKGTNIEINGGSFISAGTFNGYLVRISGDQNQPAKLIVNGGEFGSPSFGGATISCGDYSTVDINGGIFIADGSYSFGNTTAEDMGFTEEDLKEMICLFDVYGTQMTITINDGFFSTVGQLAVNNMYPYFSDKISVKGGRWSFEDESILPKYLANGFSAKKTAELSNGKPVYAVSK